MNLPSKQIKCFLKEVEMKKVSKTFLVVVIAAAAIAAGVLVYVHVNRSAEPTAPGARPSDERVEVGLGKGREEPAEDRPAASGQVGA